jgi:hypothetical protein
MTRFVLTKATPLLLGMLALAACPGDDVGIDPDGTSTGDDTTGNTMPPVTTIEPDSGSGESTAVDPTTGGPQCEPECPTGECCVAGSCFSPQPPTCAGGCGSDEDCVCPEGMDPCDCEGECVPSECGFDGTYDPCFAVDCPAGYTCLVDSVGAPTVSWCAFQGCGNACDCPFTPDGFEAGCTDLTGTGTNFCSIACANDGSCPEGMTCFGGGVACVWPAEEPGEPQPQYGDCINVGPCDAGLTCVSDAAMTFGWCSTINCVDDTACQPPPATGDAPAICAPINDMVDACLLDCSTGQTCPDGMACFAGFVCVWEEVVPPPPTLPSYGDCADNPAATCQPSEDACVTDAASGAAACSQSGCADAGECPAAPATGNAPVACGDLGGGNTCYLDCAAGQTCPDGTVCTALGAAGSACLWPEDGFLLDEDFELGAFRPGWSVLDVDGNVPAANVAFVNDAFVVADQLEPGANFGAYSTSWYTPAGQSDDWLITPQITLGAASVLSWEAWAPDPMYPDGYEVRVSTGMPTVADFTANPAVFTIANEDDMFAPHTVDLAAAGYTNQPVYIAFRNNSNDEFILVIDDVRVTQ